MNVNLTFWAKTASSKQTLDSQERSSPSYKPVLHHLLDVGAVALRFTQHPRDRQGVENPYRLARDIRGIGFKTADAIAMRLGIEKTAMIRLRAGISYALTEAMDEGHCGLPTDQLIPLAKKLLEAPKEMILTEGGALALALIAGATAGPLEDANAAYQRGDYATVLQMCVP